MKVKPTWKQAFQYSALMSLAYTAGVIVADVVLMGGHPLMWLAHYCGMIIALALLARRRGIASEYWPMRIENAGSTTRS